MALRGPSPQERGHDTLWHGGSLRRHRAWVLGSRQGSAARFPPTQRHTTHAVPRAVTAQPAPTVEDKRRVNGRYPGAETSHRTPLQSERGHRAGPPASVTPTFCVKPGMRALAPTYSADPGPGACGRCCSPPPKIERLLRLLHGGERAGSIKKLRPQGPVRPLHSAVLVPRCRLGQPVSDAVLAADRSNLPDTGPEPVGELLAVEFLTDVKPLRPA